MPTTKSALRKEKTDDQNFPDWEFDLQTISNCGGAARYCLQELTKYAYFSKANPEKDWSAFIYSIESALKASDFITQSLGRYGSVILTLHPIEIMSQEGKNNFVRNVAEDLAWTGKGHSAELNDLFNILYPFLEELIAEHKRFEDRGVYTSMTSNEGMGMWFTRGPVR